MSDFLRLSDEETSKRYGVRRKVDFLLAPENPSPALERVWDAAGLNADVGTDTSAANNDFDSLYPWNRIITCNIGIEDGRAVPVAYDGGRGFIRDGSNGPVAVQIPLFYTAPRFPGDGYEYWGVSGKCYPGWSPNPAFVDAKGNLREYIYIAAYEVSYINGRLGSISGAYPLVSKTLSQFRDLARAVSPCAQLFDIWQQALLEDLFAVEFSTLSSHDVMAGACNLPYSNAEADSILKDSPRSNSVFVTPEYAKEFVAGQTIGIGYQRGKNQVCPARTVLNVNSVIGEITFDGEPLDVLKGQYIYTQGYKCGSSDGVMSKSGSPVSNHNGKHCCKYRGIENLWGNIYKWVDGCCVDNYRVWVCTNPEQYSDDYLNGSYKQLNYKTAEENGFPIRLGYDSEYPWVRLPISVENKPAALTADFYYQGEALTTLRTGGHWGTPRASSITSYAPCSPPEYSGTAIGGRLSWLG